MTYNAPPSIYPWIAFTEMVIIADRLTSVQLNFFLNSAKNRLSAYQYSHQMTMQKWGGNEKSEK